MMRYALRIALLAVAALATACGGSKDEAANDRTPSPTTAARAATAPKPANPRLILATTTSTVDSGLLDDLLPAFEKATGYQVVALSLGSGQALATAERGEADVLLVHSPDAEQAFMAAGNGVDRRLVMHNDFLIVGPDNDPAGIKGMKRAADAMRAIAAAGAPFVSRGDNSGTNALELKLWKGIGVEPKGQRWYLESGTGMGQTLQIANDRRGYTITDRATFLAQRKILQLAPLVEGDAALLNIYHVIRVNPNKSDKINVAGAIAFADFIVSPEAQRLIGEYGRAKAGGPLFFPDAGKDEASLGS